MGLFDAFSDPTKRTRRAVRRAEDEFRSTTQPFRTFLGDTVESGSEAQMFLSDLLGLGGPAAAEAALGRFRSSPGFQSRLNTGIEAVERSAAARGGLASGATLERLQTVGQELADQDFQQFLANLSGVTSGGMSAGGNLANLTQRAGQFGIQRGQLRDQGEQMGLQNLLNLIGTGANVGGKVVGFF